MPFGGEFAARFAPPCAKSTFGTPLWRSLELLLFVAALRLVLESSRTKAAERGSKNAWLSWEEKWEQIAKESQRHYGGSLSRLWHELITDNEPLKLISHSFPEGPNLEKIQDRPPGLKFSSEIETNDIFKRDWKFQASHPPNRYFLWGILEVQDWKFQARLKFSLEIFKRSSEIGFFQDSGPLGLELPETVFGPFPNLARFRARLCAKMTFSGCTHFRCTHPLFRNGPWWAVFLWIFKREVAHHGIWGNGPFRVENGSWRRGNSLLTFKADGLFLGTPPC